MKILPAIDIKDGQAVRLFKGDFSQKTVPSPLSASNIKQNHTAYMPL